MDLRDTLRKGAWLYFNNLVPPLNAFKEGNNIKVKLILKATTELLS